jgi:hypothetical protein
MARIGKIARLPLDTRKELNRRLANGELGGSLLRWLNELPAARERQRAAGPRESKLVQLKNLHRRDAEARRDCGVGEGATERDFISRSGPNAEAAGMYVVATLPGRRGSQSRAPATEGGRGESNLVQAKFFSGALGSGVRTTAEAGAHARSGGLLSNIYAGRDVAPRRPRRRAQRQAAQSPGFLGASDVDQFRPLNAGGGVAAWRPCLQSTKNGVNRQCPELTADACRNPVSATVSVPSEVEWTGPP